MEFFCSKYVLPNDYLVTNHDNPKLGNIYCLPVPACGPGSRTGLLQTEHSGVRQTLRNPRYRAGDSDLNSVHTPLLW